MPDRSLDCTSMRLIRKAFSAAALGAVFLVGVAFIIGSISLPKDPKLDKLLSEKAALQQQHKELMEKIGKSDRNPKAQDDMMTKLEQVEVKLAEKQQEINAFLTSKSSCFPADMKVLTERGALAIKDLKVGDRVLTMDGQGNRSFQSVLKTLKSGNNHYFLINGKIKVTALHRFATAEGWKKAMELQVGDQIQTTQSGLEEVVSIDLVPLNMKVYNLTVAENHNFYVSPDGGNGYLVHNTGGGGGGGGGK